MFKHQKILVILGSVLTLAMTAYVSMTPATVEAREDKVIEETVFAANAEDFETETADFETAAIEKETKKATSETKASEKKTAVKKETKAEEAVASKPSSGNKDNVSGSTSNNTTTKPSTGTASSSTNNTSSSTSTASKPSAGNTSNNAATSKPSAGSTSSSTSTTTKPSGNTSSNTTTKPSVPETKPSVPETEAPHVHDWVEVTHQEDQGYWQTTYNQVTTGYQCNGCGCIYSNMADLDEHQWEQMFAGNVACGSWNILTDLVKTGEVWVENWVTVSDGYKCSTCGATK